jgi:hypothetical protein
VKAIYTLTNSNELRIDFTATIINLTHHCLWELKSAKAREMNSKEAGGIIGAFQEGTIHWAESWSESLCPLLVPLIRSASTSDSY